MPQFDFSTYSSQIFWFALCFAFLYIFLSRNILPKIREIIKNRENAIEGDKNSYEKLSQEIADIERKSGDLMEKAELKYRSSIDKAIKKAALEKEESLSEFKLKSQKEVEKSKIEIAKFIEESQEKTDKHVVELQNLIENKIFN